MSTIDPQVLRTWHDKIHRLDEKIEALQDAKKRVYEGIRRDFGRKNAEGMKVAMKMANLDPRKREELFLFHDLGREFFKLLEANSGTEAPTVDQVEPASQHDDWRADRDRERSEAFDPQTGELLDDLDAEDFHADDLSVKTDSRVVAFSGRTTTQEGINTTC